MPIAQKEIGTESWFSSDGHFNKIYPAPIRLLASKHWTPLTIASKAANFLAAENNVRILDIGSGVGKFCLGAAHHKPKARYFGVEQRRPLVDLADAAKDRLLLENVSFIHGNFTQLDFKKFDHFYFYNSFYENLAETSKIDDTIQYSGELFNYYNYYLYQQLANKPAGTRLATFHSVEDEVPKSYHVVGSEMDNLLKFWIKI